MSVLGAADWPPDELGRVLKRGDPFRMTLDITRAGIRTYESHPLYGSLTYYKIWAAFARESRGCREGADVSELASRFRSYNAASPPRRAI